MQLFGSGIHTDSGFLPGYTSRELAGVSDICRRACLCPAAFAKLPAMPKRDIEDFISHWTGATASEQSISQQFLLELCDLLDVPQPGNQRNGSYAFEFHVSELLPDGTTKAAWPKTLPERMHAVETALHAAAAPIAPAELVAQFACAKPADVSEILKTLETFGRARKAGEGKYKA